MPEFNDRRPVNKEPRFTPAAVTLNWAENGMMKTHDLCMDHWPKKWNELVMAGHNPDRQMHQKGTDTPCRSCKRGE